MAACQDLVRAILVPKGDAVELHLVPAVDQEPSLLDEAGTDSHALAADPATPPRALRAPPCPGSAAHSSPEREERLMLQEEIMHQTALILDLEGATRAAAERAAQAERTAAVLLAVLQMVLQAALQGVLCLAVLDAHQPLLGRLRALSTAALVHCTMPVLKRAGAQALLAARQRAPTVRRQACRLACSTWRRLCRLAGGLLALCLALVHDSFSAACQAQHGCSALVAQLVACSTGAILQAHRWAGTCARSLCTAGWLRACDAWSATKRRATRALAAIKRLVAAASRRAAAARGSAVTAWRHGAARARKHSRACAALALALLAAFLLGRYSSGNLHLAPGSAMAPAPRHNTWPTLLAPPGNASKAFHAACPQAAATCTAVDATSPPPMGAPWASADGLGNATYADRPLERTPVAADPLPALVLVARATASAALTGTKHATRAAAAELEAAGVALLDWAARSTLLQRTGLVAGVAVAVLRQAYAV